MFTAKPLSAGEWDALIDDFQSGGERRAKWTSLYPVASLLDLSFSSLLRRDFHSHSKLSILVFLDEFSLLFFNEATVQSLDRLVDVLRAIVQSPTDGSHALKEQAMVSSTSILVSVDAFHARHVEAVVDLLLAMVNRPNHGFDRHLRAAACECLRQLERAFPGLLSEVAGHLWAFCQAERTHASQSYLLLFITVVSNVATEKLSISLTSTAVPLVPFTAPSWVSNRGQSQGQGPSHKELKRALAFLLEASNVYTPCAMMEFMSMVMPLALALELQASMLRVQFFGMIYSFDPLLCHVVLVMFSYFAEAFDGQEGEIVRRLLLLSRETQIYLVFRLLGLHWLMGLWTKLRLSVEILKKKSVLEMGSRLYPNVFDPLALKALKLDLLARISVCSSSLIEEGGKSAEHLFEDGLTSVAAFKWLPPWSTETAVAFRAFRRFLVGGSSHFDTDPSTARALMESTMFHKLQGLLVDMTLESQTLVPVIVTLVDRLLGCGKHIWLGERLLQTIDEQLVSRVKINNKLVSYFPIFDRIAENETIPPRRLIDLLTKFVASLVAKHGPDTGLKSWSSGSRVLGICRTMVMHHRSSRLFLALSRLLAFTSLYFPDLEVRDHARIYLRMLICVPGVKIKSILKAADQHSGISLSADPSTFFDYHYYHDTSKSKNLYSYIHLERVTPLLVKQSWSLTLSSLSVKDNVSGLDAIRDSETRFDEGDMDISNGGISETIRVEAAGQPLRVMDSKISEILAILRRYFSFIPDLRHMPGFKVQISCYLKFDSEVYRSLWGGQSPAGAMEDGCDFPAIYATLLRFSSSAPYGTIPTCHIPFLLGKPLRSGTLSGQGASVDIVPLEAVSEEEESFKAPVRIELEPREPTPGLVDVYIEANAENGQIICGQLQSIPVGIEDMFLRAIVPPDISEADTPVYYSELFNALWEACDPSSSNGREIFQLKGGKGVVAISGTRSVKLLEVPAEILIQGTERYLAPFVVCVVGEQLVNRIKDGGLVANAIFKDEELQSFADTGSTISEFDQGPLRLTYMGYGDEKEIPVSVSKKNIGCMHILIFLPRRFHLLFQMEVGEFSTLVRIRTDHWPCLAYIDDYLETLFLG